MYNDANEFASDETAFRFLGQRSGGTSTSSDLTQFTLDVQTASGYAAAKLSADVVSSDVIYVSFTASLDEGSATASPKVGLRDIDSALNGTLYSNEGVITEGFNSFALTSTNSNASGIVWSEGDDNVIFSVTDIKVSRIERNGFVPTWYDQSTSGNNATQATAGEQPKIVVNGGIVKNIKGNPSVQFNGSDESLTYGNVITNVNTASSFIYLERNSASGNEIATHQGSSSTSPASRWYTPFFTGTVAYLGYGATGTQAINLGTVNALSPTLFSFACGSSNVEGFVNGTSKGTLSLEDASTTSITNSTIGKFSVSSGFDFTGKITEYFIAASKLQDDADVINLEINNHYNIY